MRIIAVAKLFYIMGASGVGKDSLMDYARANMATHSEKGCDFVFAHRYITRPCDAGGENHISLTHEEFQKRLEHSCFAMTWESHSNSYGIGTEINDWLKQGLNVVINGSREYFNSAAMQYPLLIPVLITAHKKCLRERLKTRGRENEEAIEQRLNASKSIESQLTHPNLIKIENNHALCTAGDKLVKSLIHASVSASATQTTQF